MSYGVGYYEIGDEVDRMMSGIMVGDAYGGNTTSRWALGAPLQYQTPYGVNPYPQRPAPYMSPAQSAAYAQALAASHTLLREKEPTKSRQYAAPLDSVTNVASLAQATITVQPQCLFRPERLGVSAAIAPSFIINDLRVGKNSQFVQSGAMPADLFSPTAFGVRLKCDTAQVSATISLIVTNISLSALRFLGALFGEAVE